MAQSSDLQTPQCTKNHEYLDREGELASHPLKYKSVPREAATDAYTGALDVAWSGEKVDLWGTSEKEH